MHHVSSFYSEAIELRHLDMGGLFVFPADPDVKKIRIVTAVDKDKSYHRALRIPNETPVESPSDTLVLPLLQTSTVQAVIEVD
jgi:hypothetical protein